MGLGDLRAKFEALGVPFPPSASDVLNHLDMGGILGAYGPGTPNANPPFGSVGLGRMPGGPGLYVATPQHAADIGTFLFGLATDKYLNVELPGVNPFRGEIPFVTSKLKVELGDFAAPRHLTPAISSSGVIQVAISITFAFTAINGATTAGWSETYQTADTDLKDQGTMMNRYSGFISARLDCLAAGVTCVAVRFVQQTIGVPLVVPRSRQVVLGPGPRPQISTKGLAYYNSLLKNIPTDFSGTKYLLRVASAPISGFLYKRSIWLGGLPDDYDSPTSTQMNAGPWSLAFARFLLFIQPALLGPSTVKLRALDRSAFLYPCSAVDITGAVYTVLAAPPLNDGAVVEATGFKSSRGGARPQGLYRIQNPVVAGGVQTFTLRNASASSRLIKLGSFRTVSYLLADIASVDSVRFSQKKVGRPFGLPRGKSANRPTVRA